MPDRDKTHTIHVPGQTDPKGARDSANMDSLSTQVIMDTSSVKVGQLTIIDGPGKGETRPVFTGTNQVGRTSDNRIALDFGDNAISRVQHAVIAYDVANKAFRIFDGGKQNPILVNGDKLAGERRIYDGDTIRIGLTTLRLAVT